MSLARAYASVVVRLRWVVLAGWLAIAVGATVALPSIDEAQSGALGDLVPTDAEAIDAEIRSSELFGFPLIARSVLVQRDPDGLPLDAHARALQRASALNQGELPGLTGIGGALPVTNVVGDVPFAREEGTAALTYLFFPEDIGPSGRGSLAERLVERHVSEPRDGFVGVTGAIPARAEQGDQIADALPLVELATVVLVAVTVGLHFRALLAPLLNLVAIGVAVSTSLRVLAFVGESVDISVPRDIRPIVVVLLFGVVTDYSVFFLSRFRRRLAEGDEPLAAARRSTEELVGIVLTAGITIAGATAALVVAELGFLRAFGPGLAIAVLVGLAVALTLVPAGMAALGAAAFWPGSLKAGRSREAAVRERAAPEARRPRSRAMAFASERPWTTIGVCAVVLLAAGSGMLRMEVGQTLIRGLPADAEARVAYGAAARGFVPGILSPTVVVFEGEGITTRRDALRRLQLAIERQPGIADVVGPREQPVRRRFGAVYSSTGDAVRMAVVFEADPLGAEAIRRLTALQAALPSLLRASGLPEARVSIAGDTALAAETVTKTGSDLRRVAPVVLVIVVVVLAIFLRSLVAPLYLVAASVLALCAALGLTVYVFQDLLGHGEITFYVPFTAAVLLVALGSDYNVFIAGRIWQEARRRPLREAIVVAGSRAATAITVAGVVLALSFALLALVPLRPFRELAFTMAVGLLLDAFVVRTLLVPAAVAAVGGASAWPTRLPGGRSRENVPGSVPASAVARDGRLPAPERDEA